MPSSCMGSACMISLALFSSAVRLACSLEIRISSLEMFAFNEDSILLLELEDSARMPVVELMPELVSILVETSEPSGPFGAKAVAEIPTDGAAPAIANAVFAATGVRLRQIPLTPERVWRAIREAASSKAVSSKQ